jgi:hypothetical protein
VAGRVVPRSLTGTFANSLTGRSRGVELTLERRSNQGCGGWASYTYGRTRFTDRVRQETFWGDWDQRHSLNTYVFCQLSARTRVGAKVRFGSGFPIPGYLREVGDQAWQVSETRNDVRLPHYTRVDLNVSRAFVFSKRRLTLFAEAMNATRHANVRAIDGSIRVPSGDAVGFTERLLPFIPVAGLLVEF